MKERRSRNGKRERSYSKTPERLAASLANLEKARAAPKPLTYRPTVRRLVALRANLVKALRAKRERLAIHEQVTIRPSCLRPVKRMSDVTRKVPHDISPENGC